MGIPIIGGVLRTVGGLILPALGKIGKGKATVAGVGIVGVATGIHAILPELAADVQALADSIVALAQAIGAVLAEFG